LPLSQWKKKRRSGEDDRLRGIALIFVASLRRCEDKKDETWPQRALLKGSNPKPAERDAGERIKNLDAFFTSERGGEHLDRNKINPGWGGETGS